jgi:hypothetical protein
MKMEQTECSEMSVYKIQTPGNYPYLDNYGLWSVACNYTHYKGKGTHTSEASISK